MRYIFPDDLWKHSTFSCRSTSPALEDCYILVKGEGRWIVLLDVGSEGGCGILKL